MDNKTILQEDFIKGVEHAKQNNENIYIAILAGDSYLIYPLINFEPQHFVADNLYNYAFGKNELLAVQKLIAHKVKQEVTEKAQKDLENAKIIEWQEEDTNKVSKILQFKDVVDNGLESMRQQFEQIDKEILKQELMVEYRENINELLSSKFIEENEYKTPFIEIANREHTMAQKGLEQIKNAKLELQDAIKTFEILEEKLKWEVNEEGKAEFKDIKLLELLIDILNIFGKN